MALRVFNYLSHEFERFRPSDSDRVSLCVCGPTVHDHAHLGHARTYIAMDAIVRYLRFLGIICMVAPGHPGMEGV